MTAVSSFCSDSDDANDCRLRMSADAERCTRAARFASTTDCCYGNIDAMRSKRYTLETELVNLSHTLPLSLFRLLHFFKFHRIFVISLSIFLHTHGYVCDSLSHATSLSMLHFYVCTRSYALCL